MTLRPGRPIPRRFSRRVDPETRAFVRRRHERSQRRASERWQRLLRRLQRLLLDGQRVLRRFLLFALVGIVLISFGVVLFSPLVRVREIRVQRNSARLDIEETEQALASFFGRHLLFLPSQEVRNVLREQRRDIVDIDVEKDFPSTLSVSVTLEPLIARLQFLSSDAPSASGDLPHRTDADLPHDGVGGTMFQYLTVGGIYVEHPSAEPGIELPLITVVDWGARPIPGDIFLQPETLRTIDAADLTLRSQFGQEVQDRRVYLRAREFHLQLPSFSLWFDIQIPLEEQLARYRVFLQTLGIDDVREYVDLRLAGRVVYR